MKLSEFKDERAIEVVADLLIPITEILANEKNSAARKGGALAFAQSILKNNARAVKTMLAILDDTEPEEYHCNAATVIRDVLNMFDDPEVMQLFGLSSQTATSFGSALPNGEVEK